MKSISLDKIDEQIIHLLFQDGRMSLKEIGEKIAKINDGRPLSHVTVRNRINKLIPAVMKIQVNINIKALDRESIYILIETKDYDTQRKMKEQARLCPRIVSLETISGKFNLIMRIISEKMSDINCFVSNVIQSDDMIRNYQILHCSEQIKPKFLPVNSTDHEKCRLLRTPCGHNCTFCPMYKDAVCSGCPASYFSKTTYNNLIQSQQKDE